MRLTDCGTAYKFVTCYVDDLTIIAKYPEVLLKELQREPYNFDLKQSWPVSFLQQLQIDNQQLNRNSVENV